jgi:putative ABC transport system substrate-binding protein
MTCVISQWSVASKGVFYFALCVMLTLCSSGEAQQQPKIPRIGVLSGGANPARPILWAPFFEALREMGYVEGTNITIERRFAGGKNERVPEFAAELARLKVNLIVASGTIEIRALKQATTMIPIVMVLTPDPIESGLVANLSHPGGNITGLSLLAPQLTGKRLELLREAVPGSSHFALLSSDTRFHEHEPKKGCRQCRTGIGSPG